MALISLGKAYCAFLFPRLSFILDWLDPDTYALSDWIDFVDRSQLVARSPYPGHRLRLF